VEIRRTGRIELDPELLPLEMSGRVLNELFAHALESHPEECCGLLIGNREVRFRDARRCRNEMTRHHQQDPLNFPRDGTQAFYMNEADYLAVMKQAEAEGASVTGVYHSHVGADSYFSELDQEFAAQELFPFPNADHIVISVVEGRVKQAGAFRYRAEDGSFEGRRVEAQVS